MYSSASFLLTNTIMASYKQWRKEIRKHHRGEVVGSHYILPAEWLILFIENLIQQAKIDAIRDLEKKLPKK